MGLSKITRNFQVTLPRDVREMKGFHVGDNVIFVLDGERVELMSGNKDVVHAAAGLWDSKETGLEYESRLRKGWKKRRINSRSPYQIKIPVA